jgi:hypothetical protein
MALLFSLVYAKDVEKCVLRESWEFLGEFWGVLPEFCQNFARILPEFCQNSARILPENAQVSDAQVSE